MSECVGALVGLIVITPSAGFVTPGAAFVEGLVGAAACFHVMRFVMPRTGIDEGLDCFTIHGVGGIVGFLLTACFANPEVGCGGGFSRVRSGYVPPRVLTSLGVYLRVCLHAHT